MKENIPLYKKIVPLVLLILVVGSSITTAGTSRNNSTKDTSEEQTFLKNDPELSKNMQYPTSSMFFTENKGQFPKEIRFQIDTATARVYLCTDKIVSVFTQETYKDIKREDIRKLSTRNPDDIFPSSSSQNDITAISASFVNADENVRITGRDLLPQYTNYFFGNNPEKWYTRVPSYQEVIYQNIYQGIDLRYYIVEKNLKYDYRIAPKADPSQIIIQYDGNNNISITSDGDLVIKSRNSVLTEKAPVIYQEINNNRYPIKGRYQLIQPNQVGFTFDEGYNSLYPLVIDPELIYSTYLGGTSSDGGDGIAVDENGNIYITGDTQSSNFPLVNPYDPYYNGGEDVFVSKFSPSGDTLIYSTYIGGSTNEGGWGITVDHTGAVYVTGWTNSGNFPRVNAYDTIFNGGFDAFVLKLSPAGDTLIFSTYLGGQSWDAGRSIAICPHLAKPTPLDKMGTGGRKSPHFYPYAYDVYITGFTRSYDFPTVNPYCGTIHGDVNYAWDAFVTVFSSSGTSLIYSTFLGGNGGADSRCITVDTATGNAYITGYTGSSDFPMVNAYDNTSNGYGDVFISILSPLTGGVNSLLYSTYFGGTNDDMGYGIAIDTTKNIYITGTTISDDFPTTDDAYDTTYNGGETLEDVFVSKLSPAGNTLLYSTYLGGTNYEIVYGIAVNTNNEAFITGYTESSDFPTVNAYDDTFNGGRDVFVAKLSPLIGGVNSLIYSTFLGGSSYGYDEGHSIAVNTNGYTYITGYTSSPDFPTVNAYDDTYNGGYWDVFIAKLSP